jgi:hypothetical protein
MSTSNKVDFKHYGAFIHTMKYYAIKKRPNVQGKRSNHCHTVWIHNINLMLKGKNEGALFDSVNKN